MPKYFLLLRFIILFLFLEMMPSLVSAQPLPFRNNWTPTQKQIKGYTFYMPLIINGQHFNTKNWYVQQSADYKYKENSEPDTFTYIYYYDKDRLSEDTDSFSEIKQYKFRKAYYPYYYNYYYYWHFKNKLQWMPEVSTSFSEDKYRIKEYYLDSNFFNPDSLQTVTKRYRFSPDPELYKRYNDIYDDKGIPVEWNIDKWNNNTWNMYLSCRTDTFYNSANGSTEVILNYTDLNKNYSNLSKTIFYFDAERKVKSFVNYVNNESNSWIRRDSISDIKWFNYFPVFYINQFNYQYWLYKGASFHKSFSWNMKDSAWKTPVNIYREFNKDSLINSETHVLAKTRFPNADSVNLSRINFSYYPDRSQKIYQRQNWQDNNWKTTYSSYTRNNYDTDGDIVFSSQIIEQEGDFQPNEQFRVYYRYYDDKPYRRKAPNYEYKVYPNPTEDELNISVPDADSLSFKIGIYNTLGQQIMQFNQNLRETKLSLKDLPAGMYFLAFESRNGLKITKIIKAQGKVY